MLPGSFTKLQAHASDGTAGQDWVADSVPGDQPFGVTQYSTYTAKDFDVIWDHYSYVGNAAQWFVSDFGKPNVSLGNPRRAEMLPQVVASSASQVGIELSSACVLQC